MLMFVMGLVLLVAGADLAVGNVVGSNILSQYPVGTWFGRMGGARGCECRACCIAL